MKQPPRDFRFWGDDRDQLVRALEDARLVDADDMADRIEARLRKLFDAIESTGTIIFADRPHDFTRAQRRLLKARAALAILAEHLNFDWLNDRSLNSALDQRGTGSTREQVAGALALLDKLDQLQLRPERPGRRARDNTVEKLALIAVREAFKGAGAQLKVGAADSPGIPIVGAVVAAITGRRLTADVLYKRIRKTRKK